MPDYLYGTMRVKAKEENEVRMFLEKIKTHYGYDVNQLYPNPLIEYHSPVIIIVETEGETIPGNRNSDFPFDAQYVTEKEYEDFLATCVDPDGNKGMRPTEAYGLIEKYGTCDWYEWANRNWGNKWGLGRLRLEDYLEDAAVFNFRTPYTLPNGLFTEMSKKFPSLVFDIEYVSEYGEECGCAVYQKGKLFSFSRFQLENENEYEQLISKYGEFKEYCRIPLMALTKS